VPSIIALAGLVSLSSVHATAVCHPETAPAEDGLIAYHDCGDRALPPIIIIPGGPGLDARYILPLANMIVQLRYRVILVEPRGTGSSRAALGDGGALTVAGSIADIEAVRRTAAVEKATILGHSFGGEVAQAYAAAFPKHVQSLVLMDSAGPGGPASKSLDGWRKRGTPDDLARYDALRAGGDRVGAMRIKFKLSFYRPSAADKFLAATPDDAIHMDVMPLSASYDRDFHVSATAQPPFPVTLVAGRIDWIRGYEPALRSVYPHLRLFVVPRAGHFPWADAPAETRKALAGALAH
jgi:pimeloyl-ACP methyl ester carboxylesterase